MHLRSAEPALRDGPIRILGVDGSAVAYERGTGSSRFVVAVNPGDATVDLGLRFEDGAAGLGGHLAPIELPGLGGVGVTPIEDGAATIELAARSGTVLRIG